MKEEPKTATMDALDAELKEQQESLKHSESELTRTIDSSERRQIQVSIMICETKIHDLKRQIGNQREEQKHGQPRSARAGKEKAEENRG